jgi:hypothetical protein
MARLLSPVKRQNLRPFNLSPDRYFMMFKAQGGVCAVCRQPERRIDPKTGSPWLLSIDHDHGCCPGNKTSCGECVRGLLCYGCNNGLGAFKDNPSRLQSAADYLARHQAARWAELSDAERAAGSEAFTKKDTRS